MCGRYTLSTDVKKLGRWFELPLGAQTGQAQPSLFGRYNIAPSQPIAALRIDPGTGERQLAALRWGLVPAWADDPAIGNRMVNARAETIAARPAFRDAWRAGRRCLIPADGFYEWQKQGRDKQPHLVRLRDDSPMAFAGIWETWRSPEGETIESCTVITNDANALLADLHDRMPVIIAPADYDAWLRGKPEEAAALLRPFDPAAMMVQPVSRWVNDPRHDDPRCIEPAASENLFGSW